MKKASKVLGSIALSAALMMSVAAPAFAEPWIEGDADFDGSSQSIDIYVDDEYTGTVDESNIAQYYTSGAYLFKRGNGTWNVVYAPKCATIENVLKAGEAGDLWNDDAAPTLEFVCWNEYQDANGKYYENEPYELWTFSYDSLKNQNLWYPDTTLTSVEGAGVTGTPSPVIAFEYASDTISTDAALTASNMAKNWADVQNGEAARYKWQKNTRFLSGLNTDTIDATDGANMGKRFPSSITEIHVYTAE